MMLKRLFCSLFLAFVLLLALETPASASTTKTFTVTSAANGGPSAVGTLTWAIYQANYSGGDVNYINFNIPAVTSETEIVLGETLYIARPMILNATTQPGYSGQPLIRINCNKLSSGFCLVGNVAGIPPLSGGAPSTGSGSTVRGFRFINYLNNAVTILRGADSNVIADNWIGFGPTQSGSYFRNVSVSALCGGIGVASNSNTISRNTISAVYNAITVGEDINSPTGALCKNNVFDHNFIGTDPTGMTKIGNDSDGIFFGAGAQQNVIGPGNVLSGMASSGVELLHSTATGNIIFGNLIGLNAAGNDVIPNAELGILIANGANNNSVGGPYGGAYPGNIISGNTLGAVCIGTGAFPGPNGTNNNRIEGNFIGTDGTKAKQLGSQGTGITIQSNGTGNVVRKNVIVGQVNHGVVLANASINALYGNWIGMTDSGKLIPNGHLGVYLVDSSNNTVQLPASSVTAGQEQNLFGSNPDGAVAVYGTSTGNIIDQASLTAPSASSQLLNLSTRKEVAGGTNVLIGGFIVTGTDPKKVLVRGLGPSLPVTGALADPTLELHDANTTIATNDNWKVTQAAEIIATGAAPANDLESAIVATLPAKPAAQGGASYTTVLAGKNNASGIGLVEIYDIGTGASSKLANISTRGSIGTGNDVLIGGFIPGPSDRAAGKVLVRGLGPSLGTQGVAGALQDPVLEIHNADGSIVTSNDNWKSAPNATDIQATGAAPSDDREAAILITLAASSSGYTAVVRGANNTSGVALVEVFDLN
ncbi:MAG: hypothetical protein ACJ8KU_00285 [Chthoniobacterales bacterium]